MTDLPSQAPEPSASNAIPWDSIRLVTSVTAVSTVAWLSIYGQPQMYRPVMTAFGQGEETVGWMWSVETWAGVIAIVLVAGPLTRWSRNLTALVGSLMFITGNVASAFLANLETDLFSGLVGNFELLVAFRALVSAGGGIMAASTVAACASALNPERMFAITTVTWGLVSALEGPGLALAITPYGASGGFLAMAGAAVFLLPFSFWLLPPSRIEKQEAQKEESKWLAVLSAPNRALALIAILAILIYEIGQGGIYVLTALIGEHAGMDEQAVGNAYFIGSIVGLVGGVAAGWLGSRFGFLWPVVIGISLNVVAAVLYVFCTGATEFTLLYILWSAAYYFITPFLYGALARLDNLGRWAVALDAGWAAGDAIGPGIAGSVLERGSYLHVGGLVLITGLLGLVILASVMRRLDAMGDELPGGKPATVE